MKFDVNEYNFYSKFNNKIKKNNFDKNIQIPIKYKICSTFNVYIFKKIDYDLNNTFLKKINKNNFYNILNQSIFIIF